MTPSRTRRWTLGLLGGALAGAGAVFVATPGAVIRPEIQAHHFNLKDEKPVTPQKLLSIPTRYLDFDLELVVELAQDTELDLVFHKVEQWLPSGSGFVPPFPARFHVLRLSTRGSGRALLTREQALFEDEVDGIRVQPGRSITITMQGRGYDVRANVGGTDIPWTRTADDHGNLALVVRGGHALVKRMKISPWATPVVLMPVGWGAILGALGGCCLVLFGAGPWRLSFALLLWLAGGLAAWGLLTHAEFLPGREPQTWVVVLAGFCLLPCGLLVPLGVGRYAIKILAGLLVGLVMLEWSARELRGDLSLFEDRRLRLYFGQLSGSAPFDALSRRLSNEQRIHEPPGQDEDANRYDVLFLGGKLLFDRSDGGRSLKDSVVSQVTSRLQTQLGREIEAAALPTMFPFVYQQQLMFERFYLDYRPKVVVLGLYDAEDQPELSMPARELDDRLPEADQPGWSTLVDLWSRKAQSQVAPSRPGDLDKTLSELQQMLEFQKAKILIVLDNSLSAERAAEVEKFAKGKNVPLVKGFDLWQGNYPFDEVTTAVRRLLPK